MVKKTQAVHGLRKQWELIMDLIDHLSGETELNPEDARLYDHITKKVESNLRALRKFFLREGSKN